MAWSSGGARAKMRMGLSAAYATLQKHGGDIEVASAMGQGTADVRVPALSEDHLQTRWIAELGGYTGKSWAKNRPGGSGSL